MGVQHRPSMGSVAFVLSVRYKSLVTTRSLRGQRADTSPRRVPGVRASITRSEKARGQGGTNTGVRCGAEEKETLGRPPWPHQKASLARGPVGGHLRPSLPVRGGILVPAGTGDGPVGDQLLYALGYAISTIRSRFRTIGHPERRGFSGSGSKGEGPSAAPVRTGGELRRAEGYDRPVALPPTGLRARRPRSAAGLQGSHPRQ